LLLLGGGSRRLAAQPAGELLSGLGDELQSDAVTVGNTLTFSVSTTEFDVALESGGYSGGITKLAPYSPVTHVLVVILENHSSDKIFAMSGIPGITVATTGNCNSHNGETYCVQSSAPLSRPAAGRADVLIGRSGNSENEQHPGTASTHRLQNGKVKTRESGTLCLICRPG
jgi:hypothetical protein